MSGSDAGPGVGGAVALPPGAPGPGAGAPGPGAGGGAAGPRRSLWGRLAAYSLGSVVAATCGEAAFVAVYGWLAAGTWAASAAGFVGGAIPNFVVNRRWVWGDRRGRRRGAESALYWSVAVSSYLASVAATDATQAWARRLTDDRAWRVVAVATAYLAVAGVFFVVKFVLFHLVVFRPGAEQRPAAGAGGPGGARRAPATRS